jgi:probable F420-dependent oxidoreductase
MTHVPKIGVILPHFGGTASRTALLDTAVFCERAGFDSLWVRDHIVYHPHRHDDSDRAFVDAFVSLAAVASVTTTIKLGTGTMIPFRHPVHAARLVASLDLVAGPDRIIVGIGLGGSDHEFAVVGMNGWDRRKVVPQYVDIMRRLWTGEEVTCNGEHYEFERAVVRPAPISPPPVWYAGVSGAAIRRAVGFCDGWIPSHLPLRLFGERVQQLRDLAARSAKPSPQVATIPYVVPDMAGVRLNLPALLAVANRRYPRAAPFETLADLDGMVITGSPGGITEGILRCRDAGATHVVLDLRLAFDHLPQAVAILGEDVLPALRAA